MSLTTEEKLVWLGVKQNTAKASVVSGDIQRLRETIGDWSAFQSAVDADGSYTDFETTLTDAGWTADEAQRLITKIQSAYEDTDSSGTTWDEFAADVADRTSYEDWSTVFGSTTGLIGDTLTENGEPIAGVRIHEEAGVSYDGVSVPAGTTEVFGQRVEFSQQGGARAAPAVVTYSNLRTDSDDNTATVGNPVDITADVTNPNNFPVTVTVPLTGDGEVVRDQRVSINANGTETVTFRVTRSEYVCVDYAIGETDPVLVCWRPGGLGSL
jgi:hypothetical protein